MASPADRELSESAVDRDPIVQFQRWFEEAKTASEPLPEAMTLATAGRDGAPSARMVLCKGVDDRGFTFFTNYESEKGTQLAENPRAALVFYWPALGRQVRVTGTVSRLPADASDAYFATRPLESRLSAAASPQSRILESREALEARVDALRARGTDPPRPGSWGGYRLAPTAIEFWLHRDNRLHDRIRYRRRADGAWRIERLAP